MSREGLPYPRRKDGGALPGPRHPMYEVRKHPLEEVKHGSKTRAEMKFCVGKEGSGIYHAAGKKAFGNAFSFDEWTKELLARETVHPAFSDVTYEVGGRKSSELNSLNYKDIDKMARSAPVTIGENVSKLSGYLCGRLHTPHEKARAIFAWITDTISYDIHGKSTGSPATSTKDVLRSKTATAEGYCNLFMDLCKSVGLKTKIIRGWAKSYGYEPGQHLRTINHAWIHLYLNDEWYIVDPTLGAGTFDGVHVHRRFDDFFFLPPPRQYVFIAHPKEPEDQLIEPPWTREDFHKAVYLKSGFFKHKLSLGSNVHSEVSAEDHACVTLMSDIVDDVEISGYLVYNSKRLSIKYLFFSRQRNGFSIVALLPYTGRYTLVMKARRRGSKEFEEIAEYVLVSRKGLPFAQIVFPNRYEHYEEFGCTLYSPLCGILKSRVDQKVELSCPEARSVVVNTAGVWHHLHLHSRTGNWVGNVETPLTGTMAICVERQGHPGYSTIVEYTIENALTPVETDSAKKSATEATDDDILVNPFVCDVLESDIPIVYPALRRYGISLGSHKQRLIECERRCEVLLWGVPEAPLSKQGIKATLYSASGTVGRSCHCKRDGESVFIQVIVPKPGRYRLLIQMYTNKERGETITEDLVDYVVHTNSGEENSFVVTDDALATLKASIQRPWQRFLSVDDNHHFLVTVPGAEGVAVNVNNQWTHLIADRDNEFYGDVSFVRGVPTGIPVVLVARFSSKTGPDGKPTWIQLAEYRTIRRNTEPVLRHTLMDHAESLAGELGWALSSRFNLNVETPRQRALTVKNEMRLVIKGSDIDRVGIIARVLQYDKEINGLSRLVIRENSAGEREAIIDVVLPRKGFYVVQIDAQLPTRIPNPPEKIANFIVEATENMDADTIRAFPTVTPAYHEFSGFISSPTEKWYLCSDFKQYFQIHLPFSTEAVVLIDDTTVVHLDRGSVPGEFVGRVELVGRDNVKIISRRDGDPSPSVLVKYKLLKSQVPQDIFARYANAER